VAASPVLDQSAAGKSPSHWCTHLTKLNNSFQNSRTVISQKPNLSDLSAIQGTRCTYLCRLGNVSEQRITDEDSRFETIVRVCKSR
jgi:hypothetical protein